MLNLRLIIIKIVTPTNSGFIPFCILWQNVDFIFAYRKKNPVFVLAAAMQDFADFPVGQSVLRRQRAALGEDIQ